jgi:hypothetical protein
VHVGGLGQQRAAARQHDGVIVDDKYFHASRFGFVLPLV